MLSPQQHIQSAFHLYSTEMITVFSYNLLNHRHTLSFNFSYFLTEYKSETNVFHLIPFQPYLLSLFASRFGVPVAGLYLRSPDGFLDCLWFTTCLIIIQDRIPTSTRTIQQIHDGVCVYEETD